MQSPPKCARSLAFHFFCFGYTLQNYIHHILHVSGSILHVYMHALTLPIDEQDLHAFFFVSFSNSSPLLARCNTPRWDMPR
jgi:hypothetical protein